MYKLGTNKSPRNDVHLPYFLQLNRFPCHPTSTEVPLKKLIVQIVLYIM